MVHDIVIQKTAFEIFGGINLKCHKDLGVAWYCTCSGFILFVSFDVASIVPHVLAPSGTFFARYDGGKVKACVYP
jgi:hypothetical protein